MSDATYNHQTIIQYLLGALSEAETERLDELSFTSEEFAETLNATEKDLVDAYVQGELSGKTLKHFEGRYLASGRLREKVEFADALQSFSTRESSAQTAGKRESNAGWFAAFSAYLTPRPVLQWGLLAAALALVFTAVWLVVDNVRLRRQMAAVQREAPAQREQELLRQIADQQRSATEERDELARLREERSRLEQELAESRSKSTPSEGEVLSFVLAPPLRGAGEIPTFKLTPKTKQISVQLELEARDYSAYRVELVNAAGNLVLWRSGDLKPKTTREHKTVTVSFAGSLLQSQNYVLRVNGLVAGGGSEIVGDYPFRVVR